MFSIFVSRVCFSQLDVDKQVAQFTHRRNRSFLILTQQDSGRPNSTIMQRLSSKTCLNGYEKQSILYSLAIKILGLYLYHTTSIQMTSIKK